MSEPRPQPETAPATVCPIRHCHGALDGPMIMCERHMSLLPARSLCALRRAARDKRPWMIAAVSEQLINDAQRAADYAYINSLEWGSPR